ncbi:MAG: DUF3795 domain-containing protein [Promethearchaeota archaeon]
MTNLSIQEVNNEERFILSPCGILCLGCDFYIGEAVEAAKKIYEIWDGWNMVDIGPVIGQDQEGIRTTLRTLKQFLDSNKKKCPGCHDGGMGSAICGIAKCVNSKEYWTCAECEEYDPNSKNPCPYVSEEAPLMVDKGKTMKMICERYSQNPCENLKSSRQIGYHAFIEKARKKVENGWRTWKIISDKMIFSKEQ